MKRLFGIFLVTLMVVAVPIEARAQSLEQRIAAMDADVIFMRHALAPGFGDPDNFSIDDCSTQRNLNEEGKAQAKRLGAQISSTGIELSDVLSSKWCRCLETARLMNLGEVTPFDGLNSFFQGHVDRDATLALLETYLENKPDDQIDLMVTHQVLIRAMTGISPASGGIVLYNSKSAQAEQWSFD